MIPRTVPTWQIKNWQDELKQLICTPEALITRVELGAEWLPKAIEASTHFQVRATESFVSRIKKGDPFDPLLRQILPLGEELESPPSFSPDPLQEQQFSPCPGVIHKYASRVLLIAATQCAINCRYCFRRHFPYDDNRLSRNQWAAALTYIEQTESVNEVILSGGDPLSMSDKQLAWLTEQIAAIRHIKRLRIHSRYPIILPSRITQELLAGLGGSRLDIVMVCHCNHPQEIDEEVIAGFKELKQAGFLVLNQTVLLKNINDNSDILTSLSERLFAGGVLPYYLHLLDPVQGAAHFAVSDLSAKQLYRALLASLPGYLVPKMVREMPFELSKTPIGIV